MKTKIALSILAIFLLASCYEKPKSTLVTDNSKIQVELLFEHDGVKVYRFFDSGRPIYYTDARGATNWHTGGKTNQKHIVQTLK